MKKVYPVFLFLFLFTVLFAAPLSAQNASPIMTENLNKQLKAPITLKAQDASLSEVLKILASRSEMNFVAGPGVQKERITIILEKTPLDEAINLLVRAAGLSYEIIGNSVLIAESERLKGEVGLSAYVVRLKYANAVEVMTMLKDLTENVKVDAGGNRLICYTSPRVINEIERIVKSIDHPHIQVLLETRLIEVTTSKLKDYGVDWASLSPLPGGISHPAVNMREGYNANNWQLQPVELYTKLSLMSENGDARILMDAKLTTSNNRPAELHIGEVIPYTIQSYNLSASGGANREMKKEEVGVKLKVQPHVNDDNEITLMVEPEVSSIIGWRGENGDIPHTKKRVTRTSVRVRDGETVFLSGLASEEKTLDIRKLPILGDIPLLGRLFQKRKDSFKKSNLILEVTPRIFKVTVEPEAAKEANRVDPNLIEQEEPIQE